MSERISPSQSFCLLVLFLLGSAWLFGLGAEAEQAAWLANLVGVVAGLGLVAIYLRLANLYPGRSLVQFLPKIIGLYPGKFLALVYILYFLYLAARVTRDFAEITVTTLLPDTPMGLIATILLLLVVYALRHGREVLARTSEALLPIGMLPVLVATVLVMPRLKAENLLPVLGPGIKPILLAAFPYTVTVPYGEAVVFLMVWASVAGRLNRSALRGTVLAGLFLTYLSLINTGTLGAHLLKTSQFPLMEMVRQVAVTDVIDRLDAVAVLAMSLGGFMKVAVFYWGAAVGLAQWFGLSDYRPLVLPLLTIVGPLSLAGAANYTEHIRVGLKMVPFLLHLPLQIFIPVLLLVTAQVRHAAATEKEQA
jgi:spore germination protein KB